MSAAQPRVLLDVTDLMWLIAADRHPTGIPRVVAECLAPLMENVPVLVPVFFSRVSRAFCRVDGRRLAARDIDYVRKCNPASKDHLRRLRAYLGVLRTGRVVPQADDVLLILGGGWGYGRRHGYLFGANRPPCRVVWFCHDLIPVLYPQFTKPDANFPQAFAAWLDAALEHGHEFICASRFVEADLRRYAAERRVDVRVSVVPLAHEFKAVDGPLRESVRRLASRSTVLCVSSIATRKNQVALLEAWARLHDEFGDRLPTLALAGDLIDTAPVDDFLRRTNNVGGAATLLGPVSDAELTWLYRNCSFTVFPSLNEGWGIPVGESLWMGKPCVSSNLASMPEAGGAYASYFDPRNEAEMLTVLRQGIRGEFSGLPPPRDRLRSWRQVAEDIAKALLHPSQLQHHFHEG
ncbi:MAG: glycosyltransferase [Hyphomicrobiales bacterium]|nr:glycosyltransferase [Hyphomicrobiales bacterium]